MPNHVCHHEHLQAKKVTQNPSLTQGVTWVELLNSCIADFCLQVAQTHECLGFTGSMLYLPPDVSPSSPLCSEQGTDAEGN